MTKQEFLNKLNALDISIDGIALAAVEQNGYAIRHIKNPSEEVQLAAVKKNGHIIRFIKETSELVNLEAVRECGDAIQYIKKPTPEMIILSLEQNKENMKHINIIKILSGFEKRRNRIV